MALKPAANTTTRIEPEWTAERIGDQSGKTFVITGANSGLGLISARELAGRGGRIVMAVRDAVRGEEAAAAIRDIHPAADVTVHTVDLLDLDSIRRGAERIARDRPVDVLINNAGIALVDHAVTPGGVEKHFAANHLGHFALTGLLLGSLRRGRTPRVVTVTSLVHAGGSLNLDDIGWARRYSRQKAYAASKLANAAFGVELNRRERSGSVPITSVLAHPGYTNTPMQHKGPGGALGMAMGVFGNLFAQSPEQGALPQLYAATEPGLAGGSYIGPHRGRSGYPAFADLAPKALDADLASRLWNLSEELTGITFA